MSHAAASARHSGEELAQPVAMPSVPQYPFGGPFGRADEIASITGLIRGGRSLVTITGPGGVGKTRFALAVLAELNGSALFPERGVLAALAPVAAATLVIPTVAHTLGVVAQTEGDPVDRVVEAIRGRRLHLVLDNLEHLLGASLDVARLLNGSPDLFILATSRRAPRLSAEQEFPLAPLRIAKWDRG